MTTQNAVAGDIWEVVTCNTRKTVGLLRLVSPMNYTYNVTHKKLINIKTQTGGISKHLIYETMGKN